MAISVCEYEPCSREFSSSQPHARFCSASCNGRAWRATHPGYYREYARKNPRPKDTRGTRITECLSCGEWFTTREERQECCSSECRQALTSHRTKHIRECRWCGHEFLTSRGLNYYCSATCSAAGQRHRVRDATVRQYRRRQLSTPTVYVIQAENGGPVKIGYSESLPERMRQLQAGNPHKLVVRAKYAAGRDFERDLHARFAHLRLNGEWFEEECLNHLPGGYRPPEQHPPSRRMP